MFLQIPPKVAGLVLGMGAAITLTIDAVLLHRVWFGPAYLLIIAMSSWLISFRWALALGLVLISFNILVGKGYNTYQYGELAVLNFILKFGCVLIVALMLSAARRALEREWRLARTDLLTGALNRQAFFEAVKEEAGQSGPVVLIFADVDGLKHLNDVAGHEAGDAGLRSFATRVRSSIRKNDIFARIGGDEFVIFMRVRDHESAKIVANRINDIVNSKVLDYPDDLKCSLGVLFLENGSSSLDAELRLADKLMYTAKQTKSGFLLAFANTVVGLNMEFSALEIALPANRKSVVRQEAGGKADFREIANISKIGCCQKGAVKATAPVGEMAGRG